MLESFPCHVFCHLLLSQWSVWVHGLQECSLCEDARFARTGVCISCDAGMCRSFFHVTCAQREGLLSEAAAEEVRVWSSSLNCI